MSAGYIQQQTLMPAAAAHAARRQDRLAPRGDLTLVRVERRVVYSPTTWIVSVDGQVVDNVGIGERLEFYVRPGPHELAVRPPAPSFGSVRAGRPLRFAAVAGQVVDFTCTIFGPGWRVPIVLAYVPPGGRIVGN